jgi:amino acid ABC transporter membrane protein 2, PAAT family (TC 3.A.1.3.-)
MNEEFIFLLERLVPALNKGVLVSLQLIVPSAILGIFFGVVVGACRAFGGRFLGALANGYAALFRGTPLVIQLFILYFGLPNVGIYFQPYTAAVLGFTLCSAAYHSEYIRAACSPSSGSGAGGPGARFFNVHHAGLDHHSPGLSPGAAGLWNEIVYLIKYSSLAYVITCFELTGQAKIVASESFRFSEVFMVVGVYYLTLVSVASYGLRRLEKRLEIPGFGH